MLKKPICNIEELTKNFPNLYGKYTNGQVERYENLFTRFKSEFNEKNCYFASSSGRVEVAGNHTDHNGGRVITCAISLDTLAAFLPTDNETIVIKSEGYPDIIVDLNSEPTETKGTSAALVRGVVVGLKNYGYKIGGFNACFTSNVLGGAGISSSASFEVLVAEILNFLYNDGEISCAIKALVAKFSENEFFGKPCGLLDQAAISFGGLNKFDFKDLSNFDAQPINNILSNYTLVLINTGGSHADLTDEYAAVPAEMFSVANAFGASRLIDLTFDEFKDSLSSVQANLSDRAILRAVHFYEENIRVDKIAKALDDNDYKTFIQCINQSGISSACKLQNCSVSGKVEQPILKALAISSMYNDGGASRVHGGGFAGTVLNIVKTEFVDEFIECMSKHYSLDSIIPLSVRSVGAIVL